MGLYNSIKEAWASIPNGETIRQPDGSMIHYMPIKNLLVAVVLLIVFNIVYEILCRR